MIYIDMNLVFGFWKFVTKNELIKAYFLYSIKLLGYDFQGPWNTSYFLLRLAI